VLHGSDSPNGPIGWVSVIASLTLALVVMLVSLGFGLTLGSPHMGRPEDFRARCVVLLAFATPSLYSGSQTSEACCVRLRQCQWHGSSFGP
jgi:hypothetical protein